MGDIKEQDEQQLINENDSTGQNDTPPQKTSPLRILLVILIVLIPLLNVSRDKILEFGVSSGSLMAVKMALALGSDVNQRFAYDTMTPLMVAAFEDNANVIPALMKAGADSSIRLEYGQTALYLAAKKTNKNALHALVKAGVDINEPALTGGPSIYYAIRAGWTNSVEALLEAGADPNTVTRSGYPLLVIAKAMGMKDIEEILIKAGASTEGIDQMVSDYLAERQDSSKDADPRLLEEMERLDKQQ